MDAELTANVGVLQATVKEAKEPDSAEEYRRAGIVAGYLARLDRIGTVTQPMSYIRGVATLRYGIVREYAAAIAFFGGEVGTTKVGLIGSSSSMVGEPEEREAEHGPFYYTLKFLGQLAETEAADLAAPPYCSYAEAFEIVLRSTTPVAARMEFLAKVLHTEPGLVIATPIYVALAD